MNPSVLSVHESHDFAYCKHYQYFILSPKYRLLHAYSHICPDIISRLPYLPRGVSQGQIWAEGWYQGRYGNRHVIKSEVRSLKIPLAFRISSLKLRVRIPLMSKVYLIHHNVIKFVSDLWQVGGFTPGTSVSFTNKTDNHYITEILLKVTLNTVNLLVRNKCYGVNYISLQIHSSSCMMFDSSLPLVVCRMVHVLFTLFVFVCA